MKEDAAKKLALLVKYLDKHMDDSLLWTLSPNIETNYVQAELRRVAWMVEKATTEEIQHQINIYDERL